jgi:hypothetical protein
MSASQGIIDAHFFIKKARFHASFTRISTCGVQVNNLSKVTPSIFTVSEDVLLLLPLYVILKELKLLSLCQVYASSLCLLCLAALSSAHLGGSTLVVSLGPGSSPDKAWVCALYSA